MPSSWCIKRVMSASHCVSLKRLQRAACVGRGMSVAEAVDLGLASGGAEDVVESGFHPLVAAFIDQRVQSRSYDFVQTGQETDEYVHVTVSPEAALPETTFLVPNDITGEFTQRVPKESVHGVSEMEVNNVIEADAGFSWRQVYDSTTLRGMVSDFVSFAIPSTLFVTGSSCPAYRETLFSENVRGQDLMDGGNLFTWVASDVLHSVAKLRSKSAQVALSACQIFADSVYDLAPGGSKGKKRVSARTFLSPDFRRKPLQSVLDASNLLHGIAASEVPDEVMNGRSLVVLTLTLVRESAADNMMELMDIIVETPQFHIVLLPPLSTIETSPLMSDFWKMLQYFEAVSRITSEYSEFEQRLTQTALSERIGGMMKELHTALSLHDQLSSSNAAPHLFLLPSLFSPLLTGMSYLGMLLYMEPDPSVDPESAFLMVELVRHVKEILTFPQSADNTLRGITTMLEQQLNSLLKSLTEQRRQLDQRSRALGQKDSVHPEAYQLHEVQSEAIRIQMEKLKLQEDQHAISLLMDEARKKNDQIMKEKVQLQEELLKSEEERLQVMKSIVDLGQSKTSMEEGRLVDEGPMKDKMESLHSTEDELRKEKNAVQAEIARNEEQIEKLKGQLQSCTMESHALQSNLAAITDQLQSIQRQNDELGLKLLQQVYGGNRGQVGAAVVPDGLAVGSVTFERDVRQAKLHNDNLTDEIEYHKRRDKGLEQSVQTRLNDFDRQCNKYRSKLQSFFERIVEFVRHIYRTKLDRYDVEYADPAIASLTMKVLDRLHRLYGNREKRLKRRMSRLHGSQQLLQRLNLSLSNFYSKLRQEVLPEAEARDLVRSGDDEVRAAETGTPSVPGKSSSLSSKSGDAKVHPPQGNVRPGLRDGVVNRTIHESRLAAEHDAEQELDGLNRIMNERDDVLSAVKVHHKTKTQIEMQLVSKSMNEEYSRASRAMFSKSLESGGEYIELANENEQLRREIEKRRYARQPYPQQYRELEEGPGDSEEVEKVEKEIEEVKKKIKAAKEKERSPSVSESEMEDDKGQLKQIRMLEKDLEEMKAKEEKLASAEKEAVMLEDEVKVIRSNIDSIKMRVKSIAGSEDPKPALEELQEEHTRLGDKVSTLKASLKPDVLQRAGGGGMAMTDELDQELLQVRLQITTLETELEETQEYADNALMSFQKKIQLLTAELNKHKIPIPDFDM